ncbi:hypothetical protein ACIFQM_11070 [Paenibacillus sp. NRS-1782]|uniref:hypothetical protein n=1 Tax=unclassified Paenibacillus TaxID=185978 RepID=UPI003D2B9C00
MSNVNKPVIPAEVADAIKGLRDPSRGHIFSNAEITTLALKTGGALHKDTITLRKISFDTLLAALVNGYEREMTEEQAREQTYAEIAHTHQRHREGIGRYGKFSEDCAFADGIQYALDTLGIDVLETS